MQGHKFGFVQLRALMRLCGLCKRRAGAGRGRRRRERLLRARQVGVKLHRVGGQERGAATGCLAGPERVGLLLLHVHARRRPVTFLSLAFPLLPPAWSPARASTRCEDTRVHMVG